MVQTNPLKRIAVGPDYKYPLRQSIHLFMFYTLHCVYSYSSLATVNVADSQIPLADHIKILGVTLDKNLSMNNHVSAVCKSIHYHIRALRHIRSSISEDMAKMVASLACALVGCRGAASTTLTLFYLEPLTKTSPNSKKPRTSSPVLFSSILQSTYCPPAAPLAPD